MASFNIHFSSAVILSGATAASLVNLHLANQHEAALYFILGTMGGLLPDIDSDSSVPLRISFTIASLTATFLTLLYFAPLLSLVELCVLGAVIFSVIRHGILSWFSKLTVHRGTLHSIPAALLFGFATTTLLFHIFQYPTFSAWMAGCFVIAGYLLHLTLDEIYSVDLMGMRLKRSFGTALKLFDRRHASSFGMLYAVTIMAYLLTPGNIQAFARQIASQTSWSLVIKQLLPTGTWFGLGF